MTAIWPPICALHPVRNTVTGGPREHRTSFETDSGIPIDRPKVTALAATYDVRLPSISRQDYETFMAWYQGELAFGTQPFIWLHPMTRAFALCRIMRGDQTLTETQAIQQRISLGFTLLVLPTQVDQSAYVIRSGGYIEALT